MSTNNAVVTGGNRGIGAAIVRSLARTGYNVYFSHLGEAEKAASVVASCAVSGTVIHYSHADFHERDAADALMAIAIETLGDISVLVNNAGRGYSERLQDTNADDVDSVYAVNFRAPILMARAAARHMIERRIRGRIVNVGSVRGLRPDPLDSVYGGLKAGIHRATQSMALELAPFGIRVNAVAPGMIAVFEERAAFYDRAAKDVPLERAGTAEDIAQAVDFLISDQSSYITGITLPLHGGMPLPMTYGGPGIGEGNRWGKSQAFRPTTDFQKRPGGYY